MEAGQSLVDIVDVEGRLQSAQRAAQRMQRQMQAPETIRVCFGVRFRRLTREASMIDTMASIDGMVHQKKASLLTSGQLLSIVGHTSRCLARLTYSRRVDVDPTAFAD